MLDQQIIEQLGDNPVYKFSGSVKELQDFMTALGVGYSCFTQGQDVYAVPCQPIQEHERLVLVSLN